MLSIALTGILTALVVMSAAWLCSLRWRNASVVDRAWGSVFVGLAAVYLLGAQDLTARSWLAAGLVSIWGVRLTAYLTTRGWGKGEEWRHAQLREKTRGNFALRSLAELFVFQGIAAVGVATPLLAVVRAGQPRFPSAIDIAGAIVWTAGFSLEVVGDRQLARFRRDPDNSGRILDTGLWRYTRHPNYFGDAVQWWGLGLVGLAAGAWWSLAGPVGMTIVLLRVTGVSAMDDHLKESRGAAFVEYARRTSAFAPWPRLRNPGRRRPLAEGGDAGGGLV